MDKKQNPPIDLLEKGINQILSKNRESLTVEELRLLKEIELKLGSKNFSKKFIRTALSSFIFKKLFDFFLDEKFENWKKILDELTEDNQ